jgi:hypothetical protein
LVQQLSCALQGIPAVNLSIARNEMRPSGLAVLAFDYEEVAYVNPSGFSRRRKYLNNNNNAYIYGIYIDKEHTIDLSVTSVNILIVVYRHRHYPVSASSSGVSNNNNNKTTTTAQQQQQQQQTWCTLPTQH